MAPVSRTRNASKPKAWQPIPRPVKVELTLSDKKSCMLCGRKEISERLYGPLFKLDDVVIHHFCILLSSRSIQNGADNDGIYGFLLKDIRAELSRASEQNCFYCKKKGASILCCGGKCQKVFHLPCGLRHDSMHQYYESFKSFCQQHRIQQTIDLSELKKSTSTQCAICKNDVTRSSALTSIWAPCCKGDAWFHRECIQDLALNTGYYFKCPLCNDVEIFKCRMLTLGIYIPSRDPSWETEPNAFAELSERLRKCSIETCLCPDKKDYQLPSGPWEILLCNSCGSNGTHRYCSFLEAVQEEWCCKVCKRVTDKYAAKKKIKLESLDNCSGSSSMSEEQVPSQNGEVSQRRHSIIDDPILILDSDDSNDSNIIDDPILILDSDDSNDSIIIDDPILILDSDDSNDSNIIDDPILILDSDDSNDSIIIDDPILILDSDDSNDSIIIDDPILILDSDDSNNSNSSVQCISDDEQQVEQMPQIQLPIISSYGSIQDGYLRDFFNNHGYPVIVNHSMCIDLISDDDDD